MSESSCPTSSPAIDIVNEKKCSHSKKYIAVSHCFHFPLDQWLWASFRRLTCRLYIFSDELSVWMSYPFKKYLFGCTRELRHAGSFSYGRQTLTCSMWDLVPWPGIEPRSPALGGQRLSHWTTSDVPLLIFKSGCQIHFDCFKNSEFHLW